MKRWLLGLLCAVVGPMVVIAGQQTPVFKTDVTLVTADVAVLDAKGTPVPGLKAEDFDVKLDGHAQPVRAMSYEEVSATPLGAAPPVPASPSRQVNNSAPPKEARLFVVVADDLSMTPSRGKAMYLSAGRFVSELPATDVVGLSTTSGTSIVNPTVDHSAIQSALGHVVGLLNDPRDLPPGVIVGMDEALEIYLGNQSLQTEVNARDCIPLGSNIPPSWATGMNLTAPPGSGVTPQQVTQIQNCINSVEQKARAMGPLIQDTADRQVQAYLGVINALKGHTGLKAIVVLSDGLAVPGRTTQGGGSIPDLIGKAAAAAGVRLFVLTEDPAMTSVDVIGQTDPDAAALAQSGHGASGLGGGDVANQVRRQDGLALFQGIQTIADMTGGNFYRVIGTPDPFFARVAVATSAVYHIGIAAPAQSPAGKDFVLDVHVKRAGVTVHANRHATLPGAAAVVPVSEQLEGAVASGQPLYGVPMSLATVVRRSEAGGGLNLDANLAVAAAAKGPLIIYYGLVDAKGAFRGGHKDLEAPASGGDYRISLSVPVTAGQYHLRFAVGDADSEVGSVDAAVMAQLHHVGPFVASDLITAWAADDGKPQFLALEEVPSSATTLRATLELYPDANATVPDDLQVTWILLKDSHDTVTERHVVPEQTGDRLTASAELPLGALSPGAYEIHATVSVGGTSVGTVSTTIRKTKEGGGDGSIRLRDKDRGSRRAW